MDQIILPFIISFVITIATVAPTIKLAKKFKLIDDPNSRPHPAHIQKRVVPRAGGIPIYLGILSSIYVFIPFDKHIIGIILGITILLLVGLFDDKYHDFSPIKRLLFQIVAAALVVGSGVGISYVTNPFGGIIRLDGFVIPINLLGLHSLVLIADIFAFFWIVWIMNMINWAKGVDGQMPGIITVAAATIGFLSFKLFLSGDINQLNIARLGFITSGTALGFLLFNWYPSKIFPGFSGSTVLGFMIAVLSILSGAKLATALLVLLIPAIDFFYTFLRRILSGSSPFLGDQKHLHHLLLKRGWSHQKISLFYIISCAILGLLSTQLSSEGKLFTAIGVGVIIFGIILWLNLFGHSFEPLDQDNG